MAGLLLVQYISRGLARVGKEGRARWNARESCDVL